MNRKTNWAISIAFFIAIATLIIRSIDFYEETTFEFGKDFNNVRTELEIPIIEDDWIMHELSDNFSLWSDRNRVLSTNQPHHFTKRIFLAEGTLEREEDAFHYEYNDSIAYRLVIKNNLLDSTRIYHFIYYHLGQYPPTSSLDMTIEQADSVLTTWQLEK